MDFFDRYLYTSKIEDQRLTDRVKKGIFFFLNPRQGTFHYDAEYWTDKKSYNLAGGRTGFDSQETKLPTFWNTSFSKICLGMRIGQNKKFIVMNKQAESLYSLIVDGIYRNTSLGRDTWKKLIGLDASLQSNCNMEGFNAVSLHSGHARVRIGIIGNNEEDCKRADSWLGLGAGAINGESLTCGNYATANPDNGDRAIDAFGYIFVQWIFYIWVDNVKKDPRYARTFDFDSLFPQIHGDITITICTILATLELQKEDFLFFQSLKADVSSISPSLERYMKADALMKVNALTQGWRSKRQPFNSLRWPIYVINSVDDAKLPCYTLPSTQYHSFFRNLPHLFSYSSLKAADLLTLPKACSQIAMNNFREVRVLWAKGILSEVFDISIIFTREFLKLVSFCTCVVWTSEMMYCFHCWGRYLFFL